MECKRFDEYHKYGEHFHGKLVVVDYSKEVMARPAQFNGGLPELKQAEKMVNEKYKVVEVLLSIPELVVRVE